MSEPQKFEFVELPSEFVVNKPTADIYEKQDQAIAGVIAKHLEQVIIGSGVNDKVEEIKEEGGENSQDIEDESAVQQDEAEESEEESALSDEKITEIRSQSYKLGYDEAKEDLAPEIEELKKDFAFKELVHAKISMLNPKIDIDSKVVNIIGQTIKLIADKLYVDLSTNFNKVFAENIEPFILKHVSAGEIVVRVHPSREELCANILHDSKLEENNIKVMLDQDLGQDDCVVECEETKIEYNKDKIKSDIDELVSQLVNLA